MTTTPIACELPDVREAARRQELRQTLEADVQRIAELPDGYRFVFAWSSQRVQALGGIVAFESECCPFLAYRLEVPPGRREIILDVTGPPGSKAFIRP